MLKNFKPVSMLLVAGALAFPVNAFADLMPEKHDVSISQQSGKVTGVVEDDFGPVAGASVVVKGTSNGTITDMNGNFTLEGVKNGDVIQISFIGYSTQEIKYAGESTLKVKLAEDTQKLDEVVVTALGIKKDAKKLGYAVSTVNSEELTRTGGTTLATGLYGKAAGVRIQSAPGGGTSSVSISVRGLSSITGNTQPLIIMDGVPIRNGNANNDGYWSNQRIQSNGMVDINPEDVENISILKGAAASALYGSEAANGVVMITTKKGKAGTGTKIDFSANVSFDKVAYMPEIQKEYGPGYDNSQLGNDSQDALTGFRTTRVDRSGNAITTTNRETYYSWGAKYDPSKTVTYFDGTQRAYTPIDHNQWSDIFRTGVNQTYNLSLINSSEKNNVRFSYTFNDAKAMQLNSNNHKHNFNLSGTFNVTNTIKLNYTATYQNQYIKNRAYRISRLVTNYTGMFSGFTDVDYIKKHTVTSMGYMNSVSAVNGGTSETLTPDEQFLYTPNGSTALMSEYYWNILGKEQGEDHQRFIGSVNPTWDIIPGLTLSGRIATDLTVDKIEKMKVCTCLNPLHTAMSIYGCMLGYNLISAEMADEDLRSFIQKIGYIEAMPVVVDPGVLNPYEFIGAVINRRLPNPFMPDAPQRIATDTSQKLAIRFGETIKAYEARGLDKSNLILIPLVLAGYARYLKGIDDNGQAFEPSTDPLLAELQAIVAPLEVKEGEQDFSCLKKLYSRVDVFGVDLYAVGLGEKIEAMAKELFAGPGAVRKTLHKYTLAR